MNKLRKRCHNCKHASHGFRVITRTHHHRQHPTITEEEMGWGSLRDWYSTCKKWEAKQPVSSVPNARSEPCGQSAQKSSGPSEK